MLKNQAVVDEIEKQFKSWKPATYDVSRQLKAIEAFETQAVQSAEETKSVVDRELKDLEKTLSNIEEARPFDQLTVVCVVWDVLVVLANSSSRMMSPRLSQRLTSVSSIWCQRAAGVYLDTRQVVLITLSSP